MKYKIGDWVIHKDRDYTIGCKIIKRWDLSMYNGQTSITQFQNSYFIIDYDRKNEVWVDENKISLLVNKIREDKLNQLGI